MTGDQSDWGVIGDAVLAAVRAQIECWASEGFVVQVREPGRGGSAISLWCQRRQGPALGHLSVWASGAADTLVGAAQGGRGEPEIRSFTVGSVSDIRDALAYFDRSMKSYD